MSETALSREAMLAGLTDIRLPEAASGGLLADVAVVIGLAACLAAILLGLAQLFGLTRRPHRPPSLTEEIAAYSALPAADRRIRLLHMLRERKPERYKALVGDGGLYRPNSGPVIAEIEAELGSVRA